MYYVFHASLFAKIRKKITANILACIDIDFSLFNKKLVMLSKKKHKSFQDGIFCLSFEK